MKKQVFLDSMGFLLFVGALVLALVVLAGVGCGKGESPTGVNMPDVAQAAPVPAPQQAQAPAPGQDKGKVRADGSFRITNTTQSEQKYYAYLYEVFPGGEQQYRGSLSSGAVGPGETWEGEFETLPCNWQIDLSQKAPGTFTHPSAGLLGHRISDGNICEEVCKPSERWEEIERSEVTGEFGECELLQSCVKEKCYECAVTTITITESNGCETRTRTETRNEKQEVKCEDPDEPEGQCYYEVSGSSWKKKKKCEDAGGEYLDVDPKLWVINMQCVFDYPGISDRDFQLTPGQSAEGCKSKHED